jgi:RNA polymerase sigma-70 factor (ECF subfamily)
LVVLTRTRAIDRLRAHAARPDQAADVSSDATLLLTAADPGPEALAMSLEDGRLVRRVLVALPEAHRALIEMAYYEGLTHSEIANRTGTALGTVKTRLRTAMATLRQALAMETTS